MYQSRGILLSILLIVACCFFIISTVVGSATVDESEIISIETSPTTETTTTTTTIDTTTTKVEEFIKKNGIKRRYQIIQMSSNHSTIDQEFKDRGWMKSKNGVGCSFKWGWSWEVLGKISNSMIVNHFPNFQEIGSKKGMTDNMNKMLKQSDTQTKDIIQSFFPRSYGLYNKKERKAFLKDFDQTSSQSNQIKHIETHHQDNNGMMMEHTKNDDIINTMVGKRAPTTTTTKENENNDKSIWIKDSQPSIDGINNIWIVKPSSQARGVGIQLFNDKKQLMDYVESDGYEYVVQKYVEQPMTVHGRKFDIRQFVLVKSLNPLVVYLYRDCYLRFCSMAYTTDNLQDRFIHLSNHQIQKEYHGDDLLTDIFPHNQWPLSKFKSYLNENLNKEQEIKDIWEEKIYPKIVRLVRHTIESWPKEGHRNNSFELLGFDILLNEQMDPLLLEVNTNPGLHLLTGTVNDHHPRAIKDLFKVVIDQDQQWNSNPLFAKHLFDSNNKEELTKLFGDWDLIHFGDYNSSIIPMEINDNSSNAGPFTVSR